MAEALLPTQFVKAPSDAADRVLQHLQELFDKFWVKIEARIWTVLTQGLDRDQDAMRLGVREPPLGLPTSQASVLPDIGMPGLKACRGRPILHRPCRQKVHRRCWRQSTQNLSDIPKGKDLDSPTCAQVRVSMMTGTGGEPHSAPVLSHLPVTSVCSQAWT
ncbi:Hypothetical predicted protein [Pelobates cultripes]|uniref:Uncharacterized protein n=1 Tax=Pelobates cultripes TaxID=61616 RepID=A0AAD1WJL8_PELCU|nr:Hypothetical predicted protein [Pelobates cultripes]